MAQDNHDGRSLRRGPQRINDTQKIDDIIRLRADNPSLSLWGATTEVVRRYGRAVQSEESDVHRICGKIRKQQYDPARAANAPLRAEELEREGFIQDSQFFIHQNKDNWSDMGPKGYFPIERMPDGTWKVQRHLRRLLTYEELCAECAPYFASIAALGPIVIDGPDEGDEDALYQ